MYRYNIRMNFFVEPLTISLNYFRVLRNGQGKFYFGEIRNGDGLALVFINIPLLRILRITTEISMDGTFRCVPRFFQQLATVHAIAYGYVMQRF